MEQSRQRDGQFFPIDLVAEPTFWQSATSTIGSDPIHCCAYADQYPRDSAFLRRCEERTFNAMALCAHLLSCLIDKEIEFSNVKMSFEWPRRSFSLLTDCQEFISLPPPRSSSRCESIFDERRIFSHSPISQCFLLSVNSCDQVLLHVFTPELEWSFAESGQVTGLWIKQCAISSLSFHFIHSILPITLWTFNERPSC